MIKKFLNRYYDLITVTIFFFAVMLSFAQFDFTRHRYDYDGGILDTLIKTPFSIDDSLPYYKYKIIEDSLSRELEFQNAKLSEGRHGKRLFSIGITDINECDSCTWASSGTFYPAGEDKYFIKLSGYRLDDMAKFSIENGNYYLRHPVPNPGDKSAPWIYTKDKIGIRYSYDVNKNYNEPGGILLVPVSKTAYSILNAFFSLALIIAIVLGLYIVFVSVLRTLYNIAVGDVFVPQNIKNLFFTGWTLVAVAVLPALLSLLFNFIFSNLIPSSFYYSFWESV